MFFRQLACVEMAALFSTVGVLLFSERKKRTWLAGTISGFLSGLVYLITSYIFVGNVYGDWEYQSSSFGSFFSVREPIYSLWLDESGLVLLASTLFGSAIGPMLAIRLRAISLPPEFTKSFRISAGILAAMLLISVLRMFDRLVNFGAVRDLSPLILIAFVGFIIFTNQWLLRFYQHHDQVNDGPLSGASTPTAAN